MLPCLPVTFIQTSKFDRLENAFLYFVSLALPLKSRVSLTSFSLNFPSETRTVLPKNKTKPYAHTLDTIHGSLLSAAAHWR